MTVRSKFLKTSSPPVPSPRQSSPFVHTDLRGLDLSNPNDVMKENRTPYALNFRMYAEEKDSRKVTITNRKGSGFYTTPIGAASAYSDTSTTGQTDAPVGVLTEWKAMKFSPSASGPLTMVELYLKQGTDSIGPVIVSIYTDVGGSPGVKIADSGILGSDITSSYTFLKARFIEAPSVVSGTDYWVVANVQDDGEGTYLWGTNSAASTAKTSNTGGLSWTSTAYKLDMKAYVSSAVTVKGMARYAPTNSANDTLMGVGTALYHVNDTTGATSTIATGLNASAERYEFGFADNKAFWVNGFDSLKTWDGSTVETITHANLPVLSMMVFHKNRLFGVSADDPNKLIYSEAPGNDDGSGHFWYKAYLSTSFIYIPNPKASDPITAIVPFQDNLIIFTRSSKYVLYGSDPGSFSVRQATGNKGCVTQRGYTADENFIYFVALDGIYQFNGSSDKLLSDLVQPEFDNIADINKVSVAKWQRQVRFYYPASGSSVNNRTLIWHTMFQEWLLDTDTYITQAIPFLDGDDNYQLCEASSRAAALFFSETQQSNLGKQIDFIYYGKYDSMGDPAQRKRITRFFPLLKAEQASYTVQIGMDKDLADTATYTNFQLTIGGALVGTFEAGDGTVVGGSSTYSPKRITTTGYAYYWQPRIKRKAIGNQVRLIGYVLAIRTKRL